MNKKIFTLIFGLFLFASCTSPEQQIKNAHDQFTQTLKAKECKQVKSLPAGNGELLKHYLQVCPFVKGKDQIFYPSEPVLQEITVSNDSAKAKINHKYAVDFVREEDQWQVIAPLWQVQLSAVTFLYALDLGYYDIAQVYSTKESNETIKLMEQFNKLSGNNNEQPEKSDLSIKIKDVKIYEDSARVYYEEANATEELKLIPDKKLWKVDMNNIKLPADSL